MGLSTWFSSGKEKAWGLKLRLFSALGVLELGQGGKITWFRLEDSPSGRR